jgi:ADP-heptose:LPS heptosyltransferase
VDRVIPYFGGYKRFFSTVKAFRGQHFDLALIFHGNGPQVIPMAYLSGAPFVLRRPATGEYAFLLSNPTGEDGYFSEHAIRGRLKTAQLAGASSSEVRMVLSPQALQKEPLVRLLAKLKVPLSGRSVAFQVGAADPYKRWPPEHFVALGKALLTQFLDLNILILGDHFEKDRCRRVFEGIGRPGVYNLGGKLSLGMLAALLEDLNLLVTNDTGPMHLAIGLGTRTVSLFGPTRPDLVGPIQDLERHAVVYEKPDCPVCLTKKCREPYCMRNLPVDWVLEACTKQLVGIK